MNSEAERLAWVASDPWVTSQDCEECFPQGGSRAQTQYPMYLALDEGQQRLELGHGGLAPHKAVNSYMKWKHPELYYMAWRVDPSDNVGDMRGRALFISKIGSCGVRGQFHTNGLGRNEGCSEADDILQIRSENQMQLDGYSKMQVFVPSPTVSVSNVRTHSTRQYSAEPINVLQPFYTDRQYNLLDLPDYMHGLWGIKTPNDDKHSDAHDLEFLCFDISHKAVVYVLYDRTAQDRPTWLKSGFTDQDIATARHTDENLGYMEIYYHIFVKC